MSMIPVAPGALLARLAEIAHITLPKRKASPGPGWWLNRNGGATHVDDVPAYERLREETLRPLLERHLELYLALADHKARLSKHLADLVDVCWQEHGVLIEGEKKKGMTLYLYDGSMCVRRVYRDRTAYDESIGAAEALVQEFLKDKTEDAGPEVRALIESAFVKNKEGDIRRSEMVRLRSHKFDDPRWTKAMQIIADAEQVLSQACYFTAFVQDASGAYQPLPLDLAAVRPHLQPAVKEPRLIRTDEDHGAACVEVHELMALNEGLGPREGTPESERLELWAILIEAYERERWPAGRLVDEAPLVR
jgi:hypothetical protein